MTRTLFSGCRDGTHVGADDGVEGADGALPRRSVGGGGEGGHGMSVPRVSAGVREATEVAVPGAAADNSTLGARIGIGQKGGGG